ARSRAAVRPRPVAVGGFPRARGPCPQCPPGSTHQLPARRTTSPPARRKEAMGRPIPAPFLLPVCYGRLPQFSTGSPAREGARRPAGGGVAQIHSQIHVCPRVRKPTFKKRWDGVRVAGPLRSGVRI